MNTVATLPDLKSFLANYIERISQMYVSDLSHVPDEKLAATPMGCGRPPLEFTAECGGFNTFVAKVLNGESQERPSQEERERFYATMDTREKAVAFFEQGTRALVDAVRSASEEALAQEITTPWGQPTQVYALVHMAGSHMSYHDGQINYIQCLYGDGENHWF